MAVCGKFDRACAIVFSSDLASSIAQQISFKDFPHRAYCRNGPSIHLGFLT